LLKEKNVPRVPAKKEKEKLVDIISRRCIQFGDFKLASGGTSSFFFDMKKVTLDPEGAKLITKAMLAVLSKEDVGYVGGMESGAIPWFLNYAWKAPRKSRSTGFL